MTLTRRLRPYFSLVGLMVAPLTGCAVRPDAGTREIDPQAESTLKQMCDKLDGAGSLRFHVHATMDGRADTGQLVQFDRTSDIAVARPDRLYAETEAHEGGWSAWYHGRSLTILDRDSNVYATERVPGRLDKMLDYLADEFDVVVPMADLLVGKTYDSLLADVETGQYLGLHDVGGTPCHHLLFLQENLDWQIWIDAGPQPLPRKLVITYTEESDQPQYVATMDDWNLAPGLSNDTFTFAPPADAEQIPMADLIADE